MEALRINEFVTNKGIYLDSKLLHKFENMKVEIIILPVENDDEKKDFMKFKGCINDEEANGLLTTLNESREINIY